MWKKTFAKYLTDFSDFGHIFGLAIDQKITHRCMLFNENYCFAEII